MAKQTINVGSTANDGTGDKLRDAFVKVNANFTELYSDDAGDVNSVNAGTGISVNQTTGAVTVTNSAPDQTVSLADGGNIGISGTYPSFILTNSAPNATHTGDVTGATALTIADDVITYAKLANEFTATAGIGASDVDFSIAQVFSKTLTADTTFTFSNAQVGMVKDLIITGSFAPTFPAGTKVVAGTYNGAVSNLIQVIVAAPADYWLSISQAI
jgi:hypothetical protein